MNVRVIIYGTMLRTEGQQDFVKDVPEGATVRELILALGYQPHHVTSILTTVNGTQASHHRRLQQGDEVVLSVMVGGG
jgi:hypothetical protein